MFRVLELSLRKSDNLFSVSINLVCTHSLYLPLSLTPSQFSRFSNAALISSFKLFNLISLSLTLSEMLIFEVIGGEYFCMANSWFALLLLLGVNGCEAKSGTGYSQLSSDADDEAEEACEDERKGEGGISGVVVASEIVASMVVS